MVREAERSSVREDRLGGSYNAEGDDTTMHDCVHLPMTRSDSCLRRHYTSYLATHPTGLR